MKNSGINSRFGSRAFARMLGRALGGVLAPALAVGAVVAVAPLPDGGRSTPPAHAAPGDPNVVGSTPVISGNLRVGGTLSVVFGTWNPSTVNFSTVWYVDGEAKSSSRNYMLQPEDLHKLVKVSVTGSKAGYNPDTRTSQSWTVGAGELSAPEYRFDGAPVVGQAVTASALGDWAPLPVNVNYQWRYDGEAVPNSDAPTHVVRPEGVGKALSVKVIGSKLGYDWHERIYERGRIRPGSFIQLTPPELEGTVKAGQTLSVVDGSWTPDPTGSTTTWYRNDVQLERGSSYTLTEADAGARIRAVQVISRNGYFDETWSAESEVPLLDFSAAPQPIVSGTVRDGSVRVGARLTAQPGRWSPAAEFAYQWFVDEVPIPGATGASYAPLAGHEGHRISVEVTAKRSHHTETIRRSIAHPVRSASYVPAPLRLAATPKPRIGVVGGGTARVGKKLSVRTGPWKPAKVSLSYRWLRNGKAIRGATKSKYKLTRKDRGKRISVRVTGKKPGYRTISKTSSARRVR